MTNIPVFYAPQMIARPASMSPSAEKPLHIVASWRALPVELTWRAPVPATIDELARAHDRVWVEDVLACRAENGFGDRSPDVAASLPWTSGAMLSAARGVLDDRLAVAAAPCSGFHHARWSEAAGFCTFNGLMVTALALLAEGRARRVGILDCDVHYGDGTDDIIERTGAGDRVRHFTAGARFGRPKHAPAFFTALTEALQAMRDVDVVLYQAGADPHVDDPLGGFLTSAELVRRDELVFTTFVRLGVPVVWNLAGGYQRDAHGGIGPVLAIHDATMLACARAVG